MNLSESFRDKVFLISDPDARVPNNDDLLKYATGPDGAARVIPQGTKLAVTEVKALVTGSQSRTVFARTSSPDGGNEFGWTSTRNFDGKFVNETIGGQSPEKGAGKYGVNAA